MNSILFVVNDAPYGNERAYNALRLAGSLAAKEDVHVRVFLMADAVGCAKDHQKVPEGYYNTQIMLSKVIRKGEVGLCGTCMDARGLAESEVIEGAKRSTLAQLADWTLEADKVLVFKEASMFFKQLPTKESSLSYFFGCAGHAIAAAVDVVAGDEDWFIEQAAQANVRIAYVIDTHVHADHYSGGRELAKRIGASYCLHESARTFVKFDYEPLVDGQMLDLGNVKIKVLHTPGHTLDSMCLLVSDARRGPEPWFVITGDTLFVGAAGRPDLAGREREMAGMLFDSLDAKLLSLPSELEIFPGHQAGSACGVGLSGKPSSTIGFEKRWNPLLTMDRDSFIRELTTNIPARPANMDQIVATNITA